MYAEIRIFEDDGTPKNRQPYFIPASDITYSFKEPHSDDSEILNYTFKFTMAERIPKNIAEIDAIEKARKAYEVGVQDGKEMALRRY